MKIKQQELEKQLSEERMKQGWIIHISLYLSFSGEKNALLLEDDVLNTVSKTSLKTSEKHRNLERADASSWPQPSKLLDLEQLTFQQVSQKRTLETSVFLGWSLHVKQ
jgi:hypothetical protein